MVLCVFPAISSHNGNFVDSRSILKNTLSYVEKEILELFKKHPHIAGLEHVNPEEIENLIFTSATELEFWVKSPREDAPIEALSSSQMMQEQYWQRTRGNVRTALEQTIETLDFMVWSRKWVIKNVAVLKVRSMVPAI